MAHRHRTIETLITQHVNADVTNLVKSIVAIAATQRATAGLVENEIAMPAMFSATNALTSPIKDYNAAARAAGWSFRDNRWRHLTETGTYHSAEDVCEHHEIAASEATPTSFFTVSAYLGTELKRRGEVVDKDFGGMVVWARFTPNEHLDDDLVLQEISDATHRSLLIAMRELPMEAFHSHRTAG